MTEDGWFLYILQRLLVQNSIWDMDLMPWFIYRLKLKFETINSSSPFFYFIIRFLSQCTAERCTWNQGLNHDCHHSSRGTQRKRIDREPKIPTANTPMHLWTTKVVIKLQSQGYSILYRILLLLLTNSVSLSFYEVRYTCSMPPLNDHYKENVILIRKLEKHSDSRNRALVKFFEQ